MALILNMQNLKNKPLIVAAVFAAIVLALVFLVAAPLIANINNAGLRIAQQQVKIDDYDRRLSDVREFIAFKKDEKINFERMEKVFVDSRMPLDFINFLEAAAQDCGVGIKFSSSMPRQAVKGEWPSISIEADISGNISNIFQFVEKIENSPYLLAAQNFEISSNLPDAAAPELSASGGGKAHILLKAYAE